MDHLARTTLNVWSLREALLGGDFSTATDLLKKGTDVNYKKRLTGETVLHLCCQQNKIEAVRWLLEKTDIDPSIRNFFGQTAAEVTTSHEIKTLFENRDRKSRQEKEKQNKRESSFPSTSQPEWVERKVKEIEGEKAFLLEENLNLRGQLAQAALEIEKIQNELLGKMSAMDAENKKLQEEIQVLKRNKKEEIKNSSILFPDEYIAQVSDNFNPSQKIGEGGCGEVYKARLQEGTAVAIKRISLETLNSVQNLENEIESLSRFRHPNIVSLLGHTSLNGKRPCLVYELLPQGSLRDRLNCLEETPPLPWYTRITVAWEISLALAYIHQTHPEIKSLFIHFDIKSPNILLDDHYKAKLGDFGLIKHLESGKSGQSVELPGTIGYICPFFLSSGQYSDKIDIYAFGIVLAEMLTGKEAVFRPHPEGKSIQLGRRMREVMPSVASILEKDQIDEKIRETWPSESYQALSQVMRQCIDEAPTNRPTARELSKKLRNLIDGKHRLCVVCMESPPNARLQCGHAILCPPCSQDIRRRGDGCPICRSQITNVDFGLYSKTFVPGF